MKYTLKAKIISLFVLVSVLPLTFVVVFFLYNVKGISTKILEDSKYMANTAISDSTQALNELGERAIKQKAQDVAKQVEIYFKSNPKKLVDYQADEVFKNIAVQKIGNNGYTALTDIDTLIARFHSNPKIANTDLHTLAEKLPGFWSVMSQSYGGKEIGGYYDWAEADGSIKQKYMYILPISVATADGVKLNVAATTYIHDFSAPVDIMTGVINQTIKETTDKEVGSLNTIVKSFEYYLTILLTLIIVVVIGIFFADRLAEPLVHLSQVASQVAKGNYNVKLDELKRTDEIADLAASVEMLVTAAKMKK